MRCFHCGKCKNNEYVGEELTVSDEVEVSGITIFELDRIVEGVGVLVIRGTIVWLLELYIETLFKKIRQLEIGSDFEDDNSNDDDYNMDEDKDNGSADAALDSGSDFESIRGSDEEDSNRLSKFNPQSDMENPPL
ncbi:hypothetical protein ACH5RR_017501 [Cinchona calisaya]|uniref:Uncharacterized protein n=1 Tax=Cinchona calisaya TaxID=153742 RepID=A0ABD2ZLP6_9GENT